MENNSKRKLPFGWKKVASLMRKKSRQAHVFAEKHGPERLVKKYQACHPGLDRAWIEKLAKLGEFPELATDYELVVMSAKGIAEQAVALPKN